MMYVLQMFPHVVLVLVIVFLVIVIVLVLVVVVVVAGAVYFLLLGKTVTFVANQLPKSLNGRASRDAGIKSPRSCSKAMPSKAHVGSNASKAPTSRRGGWRETQGFFGKCFDVFSGGDLRNMKAEDIKCST